MKFGENQSAMRTVAARALLLWAMQDRSESAAFRASLFGETREGHHHPLKRTPRLAIARRTA